MGRDEEGGFIMGVWEAKEGFCVLGVGYDMCIHHWDLLIVVRWQ